MQTDDKGHVQYIRWWIGSKNLAGRARLEEVALQDQRYVKPFSQNSANLARLRDEERREICEGENTDLEILQSGSFAEGPEMSVIFGELMLRAKTTSPEAVRLSQVVLWTPQEAGWSLDMSIEAERTESGVPQEEFLRQFRKQTEQLRGARKNDAALVLVPLNSLHPPHWSLVALERKEKKVFPLEETEDEAALAEQKRWSIRYYDSRDTVTVDMYMRIHQTVKLVSLGFELQKAMEWCGGDQQAEQHLQKYEATHVSPDGQPGTVQTVNKPRQSDGWSCGFWVLLFAESELRKWLGEEPRALKKPSIEFKDEILKYNKVTHQKLTN